MIGDPVLVDIHADNIPSIGAKYQQIPLLLILHSSDGNLRETLPNIKIPQKSQIVRLIPAEYNNFPISKTPNNNRLVPDTTFPGNEMCYWHFLPVFVELGDFYAVLEFPD